MNTCCIGLSSGAGVVNLRKGFRSSRFLTWLLAVSLVGSMLTARAEEPDSKYMRSFYAIEKADGLAKKGQTEQAKVSYQAAQTILKDIKAISPTWNSKAVAYRLSYVTERIESLSKPPAPEAESPKSIVGGARAQGVEVKLLSEGNEPRKALRLVPKAGHTQKAMMTLQMSMGMGGGDELMKIPAIKIGFDIETKNVSEDGDISNEMRIEDVTLDEEGEGAQLAEAMKATFGTVKGMVIANTISARGETRKVEVKFPPGADPGARQSMEQLKDSFLNAQVVLPEEPVGPGAQWEVRQKIKAQAMTIDQKVTQHLVAVDGDVLTIESTIEQSAANQKVSNPAMPQLKVDLTRLTGKSKGQLTVDLSKILPTSATINGGAEMVMSTGSGAQAASMTMKTEANIKIESK